MVRVKQRYILGEVHTQQTEGQKETKYEAINQKQIQEAIRDSVKDAYGDLGIAKVQPNCLSKCDHY